MATQSAKAIIEESFRLAQSPDDRIPTYEELALVESTIADVSEFLTHPIFAGVRAACEYGKPHSVTYEQIGQLVTWAQHVRDRLEEIETEVAAIALMAHEAHAMAAGYNGDGPIFARGSAFIIEPDGPYNAEQLHARLKRIGFAEAVDV